MKLKSFAIMVAGTTSFEWEPLYYLLLITYYLQYDCSFRVMNNQLITVATFSTPIEGELAKHQLSAHGIQAYLKDEATANMAWHLTVAIGWVKLQVAESDVERAMTILAQENQSTEECLPEDDEEIVERLSSADQMAEQAFRTAIIGLLFFPLQLYSLWLLIRLLVSSKLRRRISTKKYWKIFVAIAIDIIFLGSLWLIFNPFV